VDPGEEADMTGIRTSRGRSRVLHAAVVAVVVGAVLTGCSSSKATPAAAPPNPAFVKRGITFTLEPSGHPRSLKIPAAFLACTEAKLPAAAAAQVAAVSSADDVPGNVAVYVSQAANACNHAFLLVSLERSLTDPSSGLGVSAPEAACASRKALVALLRLDPAHVAANTGNNAAVRAMMSSLEGCAPFQVFISSALRAGSPSVTPAQIACVESTMKTKTWTAMSASEAAFKADLQHAVQACGVR
jgi:hypothetical protein